VPRDQTGALIKVFPGNIGIGQVITPRSELWKMAASLTLRRLLSNVILTSVHLMMKKDIELSMNFTLRSRLWLTAACTF
jgi:hypothetical protein